MKHSTFDDFWKKFSPKEHYNDITVPTLNISGWYDIFVPSTLNNYMGMKKMEVVKLQEIIHILLWDH